MSRELHIQYETLTAINDALLRCQPRSVAEAHYVLDTAEAMVKLLRRSVALCSSTSLPLTQDALDAIEEQEKIFNSLSFEVGPNEVTH